MYRDLTLNLQFEDLDYDGVFDGDTVLVGAGIYNESINFPDLNIVLVSVEGNENTLSEIKLKVRELIGPHASPDKIQFTPALPKTRSGKIMRRILRKIAEGNTSKLGDISTLADPGVVDDLVVGMQ